MHTTDRDKNRTFHVKSNNEEIRSADNTNDLLINLLNHFYLIIKKKNKY